MVKRRIRDDTQTLPGAPVNPIKSSKRLLNAVLVETDPGAIRLARLLKPEPLYMDHMTVHSGLTVKKFKRRRFILRLLAVLLGLFLSLSTAITAFYIVPSWGDKLGLHSVMVSIFPSLGSVNLQSQVNQVKAGDPGQALSPPPLPSSSTQAGPSGREGLVVGQGHGSLGSPSPAGTISSSGSAARKRAETSNDKPPSSANTKKRSTTPKYQAVDPGLSGFEPEH